MIHGSSEGLGSRLIWSGVLLFLFGLLTGFVMGLLASPRLGLSAHLEGLLNGMFLILLGLIWPRMTLSPTLSKTGYFMALYGTYANWATTLLAAYWGVGLAFMPLTSGTNSGTQFQQAIVMFGLFTLSAAMVLLCLIVLKGLRGSFNRVA